MNKLKIKNYEKVCGFLPKEIKEAENIIICGGFPLALLTNQLTGKGSSKMDEGLYYSDIDIFKVGDYNSKLLNFLDDSYLS